MTKAKVAVTLDPDVLRQAREAVRAGRATSLSAYVSQALAERSKLDALEELLAEMLAETGGPLTAEERRAADRELGLARPSRKRATA